MRTATNRLEAQFAFEAGPLRRLAEASALSRDQLASIVWGVRMELRLAVLADAWDRQLVTVPALAPSVGRLWQETHGDHDGEARETWWRLVNAVAYHQNGVPSRRPSGLVKLCRGSTAQRREGLSWTTQYWLASAFADDSPDGRVWACTVPPNRLLAVIVTNQRCEVLADVRGLEIEEVVPEDLDLQGR